MAVEIEAKFLSADHEALRAKLSELGARQIHAQRLMRRRTFDFPDRRLDKDGAWVRLRDEGDKIELMLKQRKGDKLGDIEEMPVTVGDYEAATQFLLAIGLIMTSEQESKRELWELDEVEIMLDEWPWIRPLVEVEGPTPESVQVTAKKLGLAWEEAIFDTIEPAYTAEFDINREAFRTISQVRFGDPEPSLLANNHKQ